MPGLKKEGGNLLRGVPPAILIRPTSRAVHATNGKHVRILIPGGAPEREAMASHGSAHSHRLNGVTQSQSAFSLTRSRRWRLGRHLQAGGEERVEDGLVLRVV